ncbi:MAG: phage tail sheath subtilisin-like domain-containing protein [Gammaproteobacteria bacterium]|nr:phage tail sheath subtilisin-like domain-containing protein [Gammaproteobacteria bacterium]
MSKVRQTPGVYIVEKGALPNSVVEVATAVPAFVGYTEKAVNKDKTLHNTPRRITSMTEYHDHFGSGPPISYALSEKPVGSTADTVVRQGDKEYILERKSQAYNLYWSMLLFYQNGGGPCYIVSIGDYSGAPEADKLKDGFETLVTEQEPTMVVVPDAVLLAVDDCIGVQQQSIKHCREMQSRVSILDVHDGYKDRAEEPDCITAFRSKLGNDDLDYAAAYYPWIETTIVQDSDLGVKSFDKATRATLQALMKAELGIGETPEPGKQEQQAELIGKLDGKSWSVEEQKDIEANEKLLNKSLIAMSPAYKSLLHAIKSSVNLLPPSGALAGVYTMVDNTRGVWKAPANVSLNGVIRPAVNISHDEQEDLNVTPQGKSVNAIRSFPGEGTLVWGARTLDGNSLDWRYINVRRTLIMLEQSLKLAIKTVVFEPNDANTWITVKNLARNFLTGIWKRGGLAGATPDDAFSVQVGLGETMTPDDILEGILRITILVAPTRPAEFIAITFQQQIQKA